MSGGYVPLFDSLTTGTLCGKWPDVGLWPIVLSLTDRRGCIDVTPMFLAQVTGLPMAEVVACMKRFCQPDPYSRSGAEGGARLALIDQHRDWGWRVVNHGRYREKARLLAKDAARTESGADAERKRAERASPDVPRCPPKSPGVPRCPPKSPSKTRLDKTKQNTLMRPLPRPSVPDEFQQRVISLYRELLPGHPAPKVWSLKRQQALDARIRERCADGKPADSIEYWGDFFGTVAASDFLCGRTGSNFVANLPWLLSPENFLKVIEGNYANPTKPNGGSHRD